MRFLFLVVLGLFVQEPFAQVRNFTSSNLKGLQKADLEYRSDGSERLVGYWKYHHTHWIGGGLIVLKIVNNQLLKVWEDNNTLAYIEGYGTSDFNKDGKLDFVVAGSGYTEQMKFRVFIAFYLSDGEDNYRKQIIPTNPAIHHLAVGDIDGDQQAEIIFTEQFDSHPESEVCNWLELELKIGKWSNGIFLTKGTGIYLESGAQWSQLTLGDVDNDGEDEVLIYSFNEGKPIQSVLVYNLNGETEPAWEIPRPNTPDRATISVNRVGQIIELRKGKSGPTILNLDGSLSKIALLDIPEIDFAQWEPMQITTPTETTTVILSKSTNGNDNLVTLYKNGN